MAKPEDLDRLKAEAGKALHLAAQSVERDPPVWINRGLSSMERQQPGSRPDGGMAPAAAHTHNTHALVQQILENEKSLENALADARRLVDNFEDEQIRLESEIAQLKAQLSAACAERDHYEARCEELKNVLRSAAEIMVNGEKSKA